jgi:hypothetical protein
MGIPVTNHPQVVGILLHGSQVHLFQPPPYLVMLHSGSMRWTRGSSMYSNCKLLSTWALSTLTETGTGPSPLDDGGETHTISFIDLLMGRYRRVEKCRQQGWLSLKRHFPLFSVWPRKCSAIHLHSMLWHAPLICVHQCPLFT